MKNSPSTGDRLRLARERAGLNQQEAVRALDVDRVNLSYWENSKRQPGLAQLEHLAHTYGTTTEYLLGISEDPAGLDLHQELLRQLKADDVLARCALSRWLRFLDDWAELLDEAGAPGAPLPGLRVSLLPEGRVAEPITDSRRAPALAARTRMECSLGEDAIPDLANFLDGIGILVYRADLGEDCDISGVFYNHARLGFCILVNSSHRPGRQLFTLAHELAHALFHHQERGLLSRAQVRDRKEKFADAFAAHFLVPRDALRAAIDRRPLNSASDVVLLQVQFRVSYAMLLIRLSSEGLITAEQYDAFKAASPAALAKRLQVNPEPFQQDRQWPPELQSFPPSVLRQVIGFLQDEVLSVASAASLLQVAQEVVAVLAANGEPATREEVAEFTQFESCTTETFRPRPAARPPRKAPEPSR